MIYNHETLKQEEEEEKEDEKEDSQLGNDEKIDGESDVQYWQRILGPAYNEHLIQTLKEQEELANKLGKGKRIRKQINYAEREMMETVDALSKVVVLGVFEGILGEGFVGCVVLVVGEWCHACVVVSLVKRDVIKNALFFSF